MNSIKMINELHGYVQEMDMLSMRDGLMPIGEDRKLLTYESCDESTTADNVPGGLFSRAVMDGHNVTCELYPIRLPEEDRLRGGAVLHIISEPPGIFLRFGSGGLAFMHFSPNEHMRGQHIDCENGSATLAEDGSAVIIRREGCSEGSRVVTCVKSDMTFTVHDGEKGGSFAEGYTPKSEAWIILNAEPGARIVVQGIHKLGEGMKVTVVPASDFN